MKQRVVRTTEAVGELIQNGLFWRGNLARAVKRRDFKGTAWSVLVIGSVLFFLVWQHMQVVRLGYEVEDLRQTRQDLINEYYYLKYRLNDVKSLSRVERLAREQLGMETPRAGQVVILDDSDAGAGRWVTDWALFLRGKAGR